MDDRLNQLRRELHKLELIKQLHQERSNGQPTNGNGKTNGNGNGHRSLFAAPDSASIDPTRVSPERREILEVMVRLPHREAPPRLVTRKLQRKGTDTDHRRVGTNMARMHEAGLLTRVRQGLYSVPPHVADWLTDTAEAAVGR